MKTRLDLEIFSRNLAFSRARAKALIVAGAVEVNGVIETKGSFMVTEKDSLSIVENVNPWVSRAGMKLDFALKNFGYSEICGTALDIGSSTGGFTQVMLKYGARIVYAVDVGKNQLHESIKNSSCLISLLPDTEHTKDLIGLTEFRLLNNESYFINIGRGNTVNQDELIYALRNNILTGAIIDVFKQEPLAKKEKLWKLKNIYITPHIAGITNATEYTAKLLKQNFHNLNKNKKLKSKVDIVKGY